MDQNTFAISHLRYVPSVEGARTAVKLAAGEMKEAGMLRADTDRGEVGGTLVHLDLEGVTDEWLQKLEVEKIEGAQVTPGWIRLQYARYSKTNPADVFCGLCLVPAI